MLDPYGGSGALSFEALSRGASHATVIELDKTAHQTIKENIIKLGLEGSTQLVQANCAKWSKRNTDKQYDLVLCDPPYDQVLLRDIVQLSRHVRVGGVLVLSWPEYLGIETLPGFELLKHSTYANAGLAFYRRVL